MREAAFSWQESPDKKNVDIIPIPGRANIHDILQELIRQAIGVAEMKARVPFEQALPTNEELAPLLVSFDTDALIEIKDYRSLPVNLSLTVDGERIKFDGKQFDSGYIPGAAQHLLRSAVGALGGILS